MKLDKIFKNSKGEYVNIFDILISNKNFDNYIYTIAEAHAIDMIARTISKCEIQTFELEKNKNVKNIKSNAYWLLNIQPNYIETGTCFMYKLVTKLLIDRKALILINENKNGKILYVADEYKASNDILYGKNFTDIKISDLEGNEIKLNKKYNMENTIYLSCENNMIKNASEKFKENTAKILKAAQKSYISSNTTKWKLKKPGGQPAMIDAETGKTISYKEYKEKITEGLLSDEESVVLLSEVFDLVNLNKEVTKELKDYIGIIDTIFKGVAQKWKIPLDIFNGEKSDKSNGFNKYITFAVEPYIKIIEDAFNISLVGKENYLKGEYIKINKLSIEHKDLIEKSSGWDKLISSGFSFNQLCELLDMPQIHEEWANQHYITKNYADVKGGENSGE